MHLACSICCHEERPDTGLFNILLFSKQICSQNDIKEVSMEMPVLLIM